MIYNLYKNEFERQKLRHNHLKNIFFRSPWTNKYDPPLEDGVKPTERLRNLEIEVNAAFEAYRDM